MSTNNGGDRGYDSPSTVSPHLTQSGSQSPPPREILPELQALFHLQQLSAEGEDITPDEEQLLVEELQALEEEPECSPQSPNSLVYFGAAAPTPYDALKASKASIEATAKMDSFYSIPTGPADPAGGFPIDWNAKFQDLLMLPEDTKEQRLEKQEKISILSADFVNMAKRFSKIIISEAFVAKDQRQLRTIKPRNVGGRAGGIKYIYNGILFKLQTDFANIYGNDFYAMKTGGLELKGAMRYYGCQGLHVPLMAVIDYRGFRIVAESILPIDRDTLVYGSSDGGKTIKDGEGHEELRQYMKRAAETINIAGHYVGKDNPKFIYGPVDIEAHLGHDGRYYVIDFARVYPPTVEVGDNPCKTYLYKCMRPEFVRRYEKPLSSDAYSPFVQNMPDEEEHNLNALAATQMLLEETIPLFAEWLDLEYLTINIEEPLSKLTELIHREGINCRYLGQIRKHLSADYPKELVLNEMIARVLKNMLRAELRHTMRTHATLSDHAYRGVVLHFFNVVLGADSSSQEFWTTTLRNSIEAYFGKDVLDDIPKGASLMPYVMMKRLFKRLQQLTGVKLTRQAFKELCENPDHFVLVGPDIKKMSVRVKHMNITYLAEASALAIQAMNQLEASTQYPFAANATHHDRLFRLAMHKYELAIQSNPDNKALLNNYAKVLENIALLKADAGEESVSYFEKALDRYSVARNYDGMLQLGDILRTRNAAWNEREKLFALANRCYQSVTQVDTLNAEAMFKWGDLLVKLARCTGNLDTYIRAGANFRSSINMLMEFRWISSWSHNLKDEELAVVIEVLNEKNQEVFDSNRAFKKSLITDNLLRNVAQHIGPSLKELILDGCLITSDSINVVSTYCRNLTHLSLNRCLNLTDNCFGHIANLSKLTKVSISGCLKLSAFSFKCLTKLPNLTHVDTSYCHFNETFMMHLSQSVWTKLKHLNIAQQQFTAESFCRAISHLVLNNLEEIILDECIGVNDQAIILLAQRATQLKRVSLDSCVALTDDAIYKLAVHCPQLRYINLSGCIGLTSRALSYLGSFITGLEDIALERCPHILDENHKFLIVNNTSLTRLRLRETSANDELLRCLAQHCRHLTDLSLSTTKVTAAGLFDLFAHWSSGPTLVGLRCIELENCDVNDQALTAIAEAAGSTLVKLLLSGCDKLTDDSLSLLGTYCPSLEHLDISFCSNTGDSAVSSIARGCTNIQYLNLSNIRLITDASMTVIGKHLHKLKVLNIANCLLVSCVSPIAVGCPDLEELYMQGCINLENEGTDKLAQLKFLRILDIRECSHVRDDLVNALLNPKECPALEELWLGRNKLEDGLIKRLRVIRPNLEMPGMAYQSTSPSTNNSNKKRSALMSSDGQESHKSAALSPSAAAAPTVVAEGSAVRALMRDLKEIVKNPLPLASAHPLEDNMLVWHGNLLGPENTPFAGAIFHIQLVFPENYPAAPPSATIFTTLPHPHVHKSRICLDILSDFTTYFNSAKSPSDKVVGWSSAYSVQTILLQLHTFLTELKAEEGESLSQYLQKIPAAIKEAMAFSCTECPHRPGTPWPPLPKREALVEAPKSEMEIIRDELKCFHTRMPYTEGVLGIAISVKYHTRREQKWQSIEELNSPLDLISYHAFYELGVRESVYANHQQQTKIQKLTHWLPLYIDADHGKRAAPLLRQSLSLLCGKGPEEFTPEMAIYILPKLMNTILVNVMSDRMFASVKALEGYCAMHRLLLYFVKEYPALQETVNRTVANFIKHPNYRDKNHVPSLGEFLALLTISEIPWKEVARAYLEENFIRNVRWVVQKYPELDTTQPDPVVDQHRCAKTLLATLISTRLLMFQVYFLESVLGQEPGKRLDQIAEMYDRTYGRLNNATKEKFLRAMRDIITVSDWETVFKWIGLPCPDTKDLTDWLRNCVSISIKRGYHFPKQYSSAFPKQSSFHSSSYPKQSSYRRRSQHGGSPSSDKRSSGGSEFKMNG